MKYKYLVDGKDEDDRVELRFHLDNKDGDINLNVVDRDGNSRRILYIGSSTGKLYRSSQLECCDLFPKDGNDKISIGS